MNGELHLVRLMRRKGNYYIMHSTQIYETNSLYVNFVNITRVKLSAVQGGGGSRYRGPLVRKEARSPTMFFFCGIIVCRLYKLIVSDKLKSLFPIECKDC